MSSEKTGPLFSVDLMKPEDLPEILAIEAEYLRKHWTRGMFQDELRLPHAQCMVVREKKEGK